MSRCYVCDFHPTNPSEYHNGLAIRHYGRKPHMHFDEDLQQYICTDCLNNGGHYDMNVFSGVPIISIPSDDQE